MNRKDRNKTSPQEKLYLFQVSGRHVSAGSKCHASFIRTPMLIYLQKMYRAIDMQAINNVYKELKNMAIATYPTDWDRATRRSPHQIIKDRDPCLLYTSDAADE